MFFIWLGFLLGGLKNCGKYSGMKYMGIELNVKTNKGFRCGAVEHFMVRIRHPFNGGDFHNFSIKYHEEKVLHFIWLCEGEVRWKWTLKNL